jgi:hypothetical protein
MIRIIQASLSKLGCTANPFGYYILLIMIVGDRCPSTMLGVSHDII